MSEVKKILVLAKGDLAQGWHIINSQMQVMVLRTQVLLSLSGILVSVTGFSGRYIAATSYSAKVFVVTGVVLVLASATAAIAGVLRLKWLSRAVVDDTEESLRNMLQLRDHKQFFLNVASWIFIVGFACYCIAIAEMLISAKTLQ